MGLKPLKVCDERLFLARTFPRFFGWPFSWFRKGLISPPLRSGFAYVAVYNNNIRSRQKSLGRYTTQSEHIFCIKRLVFSVIFFFFSRFYNFRLARCFCIKRKICPQWFLLFFLLLFSNVMFLHFSDVTIMNCIQRTEIIIIFCLLLSTVQYRRAIFLCHKLYSSISGQSWKFFSDECL